MCVWGFPFLLEWCVVRCDLCWFVCVVVFVLFVMLLFVWLLLFVVAGMVCCIETTKTSNTHIFLLVWCVCLSCCFVCVFVFFPLVRFVFGVAFFVVGVLVCLFALICLCCGASCARVVVVRMLVVVGCRWYGLLLVVVGMVC